MRPVKMIGGAPFTGGTSRYRIAANYGTAIFQGDMVAQVTGGGVEVHADGGTVPIVGVFNGCSYTDPTTKEQVFKNYYPASTNASDIIAYIIDDPNVVFEVQADDTFPVADLFGNFDIVYTSSGSTTTGMSGAELNVTDGATTTSLPLKAIDISEDPENSDVASANTNVLVVIQNHIFGVKGAGLA
tara:strand:- start:832 stop:1389 length:558 start_codon:yes stop_codon:yes gene_type:complete